jgi:hypothetical protein
MRAMNECRVIMGGRSLFVASSASVSAAVRFLCAERIM